MHGDISALVRKLGVDEPAGNGMRQAAVSVIVSDEPTPSTLLIRRAERSGDPWSGQIAFPGGKMQQGDSSAKDTAVRETLEEVGFDLAAEGRFLGYGALTATHTGSMQVVPAVFLVAGRPKVRLNPEATSFRWVTLEELKRPESRGFHLLTPGSDVTTMPAYRVGDYVVWGLTYRILSTLLERTLG